MNESVLMEFMIEEVDGQMALYPVVEGRDFKDFELKILDYMGAMHGHIGEDAIRAPPLVENKLNPGQRVEMSTVFDCYSDKADLIEEAVEEMQVHLLQTSATNMGELIEEMFTQGNL